MTRLVHQRDSDCHFVETKNQKKHVSIEQSVFQIVGTQVDRQLTHRPISSSSFSCMSIVDTARSTPHGSASPSSENPATIESSRPHPEEGHRDTEGLAIRPSAVLKLILLRIRVSKDLVSLIYFSGMMCISRAVLEIYLKRTYTNSTVLPFAALRRRRLLPEDVSRKCEHLALWIRGMEGGSPILTARSRVRKKMISRRQGITKLRAHK